MLWTKGNQETLYKDLINYFDDDSFKKQIIDDGNYKKTVEKAHGQIEIREYYQTNDIKWLSNRSKWKNLKSIGIVEKTIKKKDKEVKEIRYYISSLEPEINLFEKSVRGHWGIEIMHWHLDVTFKEDSSNKTIEETANKNMSLIKECSSPHFQCDDRFNNMQYGYLWWIIDESKSIYATIGNGGNMIYVNPQKKLTVAITSTFNPRVFDRIQMIQKQIEPLLFGVKGE